MGDETPATEPTTEPPEPPERPDDEEEGEDDLADAGYAQIGFNSGAESEEEDDDDDEDAEAPERTGHSEELETGALDDRIRVGDDAPRNYGAPVHGEQRHSSMAATKQEMAAAREAATEQAAAEIRVFAEPKPAKLGRYVDKIAAKLCSVEHVTSDAAGALLRWRRQSLAILLLAPALAEAAGVASCEAACAAWGASPATFAAHHL